jgi:hypothetical protein
MRDKGLECATFIAHQQHIRILDIQNKLKPHNSRVTDTRNPRVDIDLIAK